MMTMKGFPWTVDHDTNYVTFAGNLGGIPQNWHVEYCRGEVQPIVEGNLGLVAGWTAEYFYFPGTAATADGYATTGTANYTTTEKTLNWYAAGDWATGHPATFPKKEYAAKFSGNLKITRGGEYMWSTISNDGSRVTIDGNVVVDNWGQHGSRRREHIVNMDEGWHNVLVEHFNGDGDSQLIVNYRGDDTDDKELPVGDNEFGNHMFHGDKAPLTVNVQHGEYSQETVDSAQSNPGGSSTTNAYSSNETNQIANISKATIGGASVVPVIKPFLDGPVGGSGSPSWADQFAK